MITCLFGVPRVGKNTMLTKIARKALRQRVGFMGLFGRNRYDHVYTDFACEGCEQIDFKKLGEYKFYNSLIIFGEMALEADNREFKTFQKEIRDFLVLHGHLWNDVVYATQNYSNVDKKIRELTEELWYLSKSVVPILREFTTAKRVYRTIAINEYTGDLIMGYRFCNFLESLFTSNYKIVFRRLYYRYFDSWEEGVLEQRDEYQSAPWKLERNAQKKDLKQIIGKLSFTIAKSDKQA